MTRHFSNFASEELTVRYVDCVLLLLQNPTESFVKGKSYCPAFNIKEQILVPNGIRKEIAIDVIHMPTPQVGFLFHFFSSSFHFSVNLHQNLRDSSCTELFLIFYMFLEEINFGILKLIIFGVAHVPM